MKRRRDRAYWVRLLGEAKERHLELTRKLVRIEEVLKRHPLKGQHMWRRGRTRRYFPRRRRLRFAKSSLINRACMTSMAKTQRLILKTLRQAEYYRAMIEQTKQRDVWWRLKHPLV